MIDMLEENLFEVAKDLRLGQRLTFHQHDPEPINTLNREGLNLTK